MNKLSKQLVDFNSAEKQQQIAVQPNGELVFTGIDFDEVSVDIVDTDVILSNSDTGTQVVLMGLAIYLFDEEVPLMSFDGEFVAANQLLSKVGEIGNLTMQEFAAVSSILEENLKQSESESESESEDEDEDEDEASPDAAIVAEIIEAIDAMNQAQQSVSVDVEASKEQAKYDRKATDEEGDSYHADTETAKPESSSLVSAGEAPEAAAAEVLFDLSLLQPVRIESLVSVGGVETRYISGGGGSEESGFNPANEAQFSTEVLNYGASTENLVIHTDNPDLFSENTMSRVIELTPTFPAGFDVTEVRLTGFPDGFEIEGATKVGDTWTMDSPDVNERGSIRVNLLYSVPSDETFSVDFSVISEFQEDAVDEDDVPLDVPPELQLVSEDTRIFEVQDVFSSTNGNYVNGEGADVWVLANSPNANLVFSGSGDDQITGSVGIDSIHGGGGNDIIDGGAGNDTLNGEGGDDLLLHSEGFDKISGGSGVDTLDYSAATAPIHADLSILIDGYSNITINAGSLGSEIDQVNTVENVFTGSGDDVLIGDSEDNHLMASSGADRLFGGGGNDVLDGGEGLDSADYSASTGSITTDLSLDSGNVVVDASNIDTLISIEHVIGSQFDDDMVGSADDDSLEGGAGNDRLTGGLGSDTLDGGDGDSDVADFSGIDVAVQVDLGAGTDAEGYVIATHGTEADRLINIEDLIGSEHDDLLTGNALHQAITGGAGDDVIDGGGGADTLDGGLGQDQVAGGAGDDTFAHSDGADHLDGGDDLDTIDFSLTENITEINAILNGETDSQIDVTGGDDLTIKNIENIVGTGGDDRLQGDSNSNVLDGRDGDDVLIGAAGNDILIGGAGRDTADYSVASVGLNIDLSVGEITNDGFGYTDTISGIEDLTGSDYNDLISGDQYANTLRGGSGDDVLTGRAGDDILEGGEGLDTASYEFASSAVSVDLAASTPTSDGEGGQDTFDSIESAVGSAYNDSLQGDSGDNSLSGLAGNDTLDGREGNDTLLGGLGDDTHLASEGSDSHDGGLGSDTLDYSGLQNITGIQVELSGSDYAQVITTGSDNDQVRNIEGIIGSTGADELSGDSASNTLYGEDGDDIIKGGAGSDVLSGGDGDDQLRFDDLANGAVTLDLATQTATYATDNSVDTFSEFERYVTTNQDDSVFGSTASDIVEGLGGDDHFHSSGGSDQLSGGLGNDVVDYSEETGIDHIEAVLNEGNTITVSVVGGEDDQITSVESIIGSAGDDLLTGDTQDNELSGSAGDDELDGGAGDDTLMGDAGQDRFLGGLGTDTYHGGTGIDEIDYSGATGGVSVDLAQNTVQNDGHGSQDSIQSIENVTGTGDNDIISGDGNTNVLVGADGNDVIRGGSGSDTLHGGAGLLDEVHFDDLVDAGITLDLDAGTAFYSADASTDSLTGFELYYTTNQHDVISGSSVSDSVFGLAGNDIFNASLGVDALDGGSGNDSLDYSALTEATSVNVTLDEDRTVVVAVGGVGSQNIVNIENVTGSDNDDVLGGDSLANTLIGGAGNDSVFGGAGSDILQGGDGTDELRFDDLGTVGITLNLGEGLGTASYAADNSTDTFSGFERYLTTQQDDTVNTSSASDVVSTLAGDDQIEASLGADTLDGGIGSDSINYSGLLGVTDIQVTLDNANPVQVVVGGADDDTISNIENVTGTDGDDIIIGDGQQNTLNGLGGADTLTGNAGDDNIVGGEGDDLLSGGDGNDTLDGGQGRDTVSYADAVGGVAVDLSAGAASNDGFSGSDSLNSIENIEGSAQADMLRGDSSGNVISGNDGNDIVYGGLGSDTLSGGAHVTGDTLRFDDLTGAGVQLNIGLATATFGGDLSVDTFSGFEQYVGTDQDDVLIGSSAADVVNTLDGNDKLSASAGSDSLDGGDGLDTLDYSGLTGASGIDVTLNGASSVTASVTGGDDDTLSNIENIVGSAGDDILGGDNSTNRLEGMDGSDRFVASAGADVIVGGAGTDTLDYSTFSSASAITVTLQGESMTAVTVVGSENDTISEVENIVGTIGNDVISGDDADNILEGLSGSDTLNGGLGADTLLGGDGADLVIASEGADTVDGGSGTDTLDYSGLATGQSIEVDLDGSNNTNVAITGGTDQTIRNVENVLGTAGGDLITGDTLQNTLQALGGDDVLFASGGGDTLDGGTGIDTIDYSSLAGAQYINVTLNGSTTTTVQVSGDTDDQVLNIENVIGTSGDDTLSGDSLNNHLEGRLGDDVLAGAAGNDTLDGGTGAFVDTASYAAAVSGVIVDLSTGIASEDGYGSVDTLIDIEQLTGSDYADTMTTGADTQRIDAEGGDDVITVGLGDIIVDGGSGSDTVDYSALLENNAISIELSGQSNAAVAINGSTNQLLTSVENIVGSQGGDSITGDNNDNILDGGVGDDTLQGLGGDDTLIGGVGIDKVDYSQSSSGVDVDLQANEASNDGEGGADTLSGIENVSGSNLDDVLRGDSSNNTLEGNSGVDTLQGGAGQDILDGGAGIDIADYSNAVAAVSVDLSYNTASQDGDGASDTLLLIEDVLGSNQDDSLFGDGNNNTLNGGLGDDLLRGAGGSDTLVGGSGNDTIDYSQAAGQVAANLLLNTTSSDGDGSFDALSSIENIIGSGNNDHLTGDNGINRLDGGAGDDTLAGGGSNDTLDGGAGLSDTADYSDAPFSINVDLAAGVATDDGYSSVDTISNIENIIGSDQDDTIAGNALANTLESGAGDDLLIGRGGADVLDGGAGVDTVDYTAASAAVTVNLSGNTASDDGDGSSDELIEIENLTGSGFNDQLTGDSADNAVSGGAGDDVIRGGIGSDVLDGGTHILGDELRFDDLNGGGISLDLGAGTASYAIDSSTDSFLNFESYVLTEQDDSIIGTGSADVVSSLGGDDVFTASRGGDTLDGGVGSDTVDYSVVNGVASISVALTGSTASTVLTAGAGNDSLTSIENITATAGDDSLTGDDQDNTFVGLGGDDTLTGGAGRDSLSGGEGDDTFIASGGQNTYDGGSDIDTLDYSNMSWVTAVNATLSGSTSTTISVSGSANDFALNIENLIGSTGNDFLRGDNLANQLEGGSGNDTLEGKGGADTLIGGLGSDTIDYSSFGASEYISVALNGDTATSVIVNGGATDTVSEVENVIGSAGDDVITGDSEANVLNGSAGDDTLVGGAGADTLIGGDGLDTVDYSQEAAINFVSVQLNASNTVTVTINGGDNDTLKAVENVIGTEGDDTLFGGGSVNLLDGLGGDDLIRGGLSDDTLDGGTGTNTLSFADSNLGVTADMANTSGGYFSITHIGGELDSAANFTHLIGSGGNDIISGDSSDNRLEGLLGQDQLSGAGGNDTLLGGENDDTLDGGSGDDQLDGDEGDDTLTGGYGADTMNGGSGEDTIVAGYGIDIIDGGDEQDLLDYSAHAGATAISVTLSEGAFTTVTVSGSSNDTVANVEQIVATDGADTLTGDSNNNTFWAGAGDDSLEGGLGTNVIYGDAGSDTFFGTAGKNTYYGGADNDTVDYSNTVGATSVSVTLDGESLSVAALGGISNDSLSGIENVIATSGSDNVQGDGSVNHLQGLAGDDVLGGGGGVDILDGGDGADTANYQSAAAGVVVNLENNESTDDGDGGTDTYISIENVSGSDFDDSIVGDANANSLHGNLGDDFFLGGSGNDTIDGGGGSDTIDYFSLTGVTAVSVTLAGSSPVTATLTGGDNDSLRNVENVIGSNGNDTLFGSSQNNHFQGLGGDDVMSGHKGDDVLDGGSGINTVTYADVSNAVTLDMSTAVGGMFTASVGSSGELDQLINISNITGSSAADSITGDDNDNVLIGNSGADTLIGGGGDDTISGGNGNDVMDGGQGDDVLMGGDGGSDVFYDSEGSDSYDGGSGGSDILHYSSSAGVTSVSVVLDEGNISTVTVTGGDNDTIRNIEHINGTSGDDTFEGDRLDNEFIGNAGDDVFVGSDGSDSLYGNTGDDIVDYSALSTSITAMMSDSNTGAFNAEKSTGGTDFLSDIETLRTGSGADDLVTGIDTILVQTNAGNDAVHVLYAGVTVETGNGEDEVEIDAGGVTIDTGNGNDAVQVYASGANISLGAGADTISVTGQYTYTADGGGGDDIFYVITGGSVIDGGGQSDTVDYAAANNAITTVLNDVGDSEITIAGESADTVRNLENIYGTNLNDSISGNSADNDLWGRAGDDTFSASDGADTISGGSGIDSIDYSSFAASNFITAVLDESNNTTVTVNGRSDQMLNGIENITGSAGNDTLMGDALENNLLGGAGNDTIYASTGNDVLDGGAGTADVLDYGSFGAGLTVNFETGIAVDGEGSIDSFTGFEQYVLTGFEDTLTGSSGVDTLSGAGGNDLFLASAGADVLNGGLGFDTIDYSSFLTTGISVSLDGSSPITVSVTASNDDTIQGFENVIGSIGVDTLIGDASDNELDGFKGNDVIDGGAGNDTIDGGNGDDLLIANSGSDVFNGGDGTDTLDYSSHTDATSINVTLNGVNTSTVIVAGSDNDTVRNVENVSGTNGDDAITGDDNNNQLLGGDGSDQLTGMAGADVLIGEAGDDVLLGGGGDDSLIGGVGNDELVGGAGTDTVDYSGSAHAISGGAINSTSGTIEQGLDTDSLSSIEGFILSANDDLLSFDMDALASVTVDGQSGDDTVAVVNSLTGDDLSDAGIDGLDLASVFTNVETIDFTGTGLSAGDTFDIGNSDISSITGGSNVLNINVNQTTIALQDVSVLNQDGASVTTDTTTGGVRTVDWDNGMQLVLNG